ncbi:putative ankyrin repeat protein RF_0381 [Saccostrea cucullata]|uniref:putative ankyrin repeat protein RF_0381 n=1 Tax=Saccostrea cuccullata TaxID=36930 RepID=UPI002ED671D2
MITNWKTENRTFVPTFATKVVEEKLQNQNFVIVVGNSGSGKTAMIQHIALKYQEQGWDIVPIDEVREIKEICSNSLTQRLFIMNDPIGKEKLDEISKHSWECLEKTLEICLEKSKMLVSCRRCVIKDETLQGLFKEQSNIVEIDSGNNVLTDEEKKKIIKQYVKEEDLSKDAIDEIIKTDSYFPLLCKLLSVDRHYLGEAISLFKHPFELVKKEIETYKYKGKEKYCALVFLSMFNTIDTEKIRYSDDFRKRFNEIVEACDLPSNLQITSIKRNLKLLEGSFVKCVGSSFSFIHDFVMEVTTLIFGTDFPKETIKYASSDFLRKRMKIQEKKTKIPDPLTIYLHPLYIGDLIERFFLDINSDCVFDFVLNPCLRSKIVIEKFIEKMKSLENLSMFYTEQTISIDKYIYSEDAMARSRLSRIRFISLEERITPISLLITYCHDEISTFCLNNTNSKTLQDQFLLPHVCANGSLELLNTLNEKSRSLWISKKYGKSHYPIHIASAFHNVDIVERLLRLGADPNTLTTENRCNPLISAANDDAHNCEVHRHAGMKRNQTIECLIKYGTKVNLCRRNGYSPLHFCIFNKVPQNTIELLISKGADINLCSDSGESFLHSACSNGYDIMVQFLLNKGININLRDTEGNSPLWYACMNGHESTVKLLLTNGAKINLPNNKGYTALSLTCECRHTKIVNILLDSGADINACSSNGESPLWRACFFGNESTVKLLVQNDANINLCRNGGMSPLFVSCEKGFENKVKILLNSGADVNLLDNRRATPIARASYDGRNNIIPLLLDKGADVNLCCMNGESPLFFACQNGHDNTVKLLLQNAADVNLCKLGKFSPLYIACYEGNNSIVKILLENGVDINAYDKYGCSPIVRACKEGDESVVKMLIEHGANINLRDKNRKTAIDSARDLKREDIVDLMRETTLRE